mmetsp:Transcript_7087/g.17109  ORF Transcript_7087/g.17109 Transcript_7087/m.17109 type:complete len:111 (+) Transcript_7087:79-411(+)
MARGSARALIVLALGALFLGEVSKVFVTAPAKDVMQKDSAMSVRRHSKATVESMSIASLLALAAEPAWAETSQYDYDGRVFQGQLTMVALSVSAVAIVAVLVVFGGKFLE